MAQADHGIVRMLLALADAKSFLRASAVLGMDNTTLSRHIAQLEKKAGVPLFVRRPTGVEITDAGLRLLGYAERVATALDDFDRAVSTLATAVTPVTVSAPEGIATYLLVPQALGAADAPTALAPVPAKALPPLAVLPAGQRADIEILLVAPGEAVPRDSDYRVRKLGVMRFKPVASRRYLEAHGMPETLRELGRRPLMTHVLYQHHPAFGVYAALVLGQPRGPVQTVSTSSMLHRAVLTDAGLGLLPDFSPVLDPSVVAAPFGERIAVDVWAASHPDTLRLPSVRQAYDGIAAAFLGSSWFAVH